MNQSQIRERIAEDYPDALFMDGYDDCILGTVRRFGMEPVVIYDEAKIIQKLMSEGLTEEEAYEFFEFNQIGGWHGDKTPCFLTWAVQQPDDGVLPVIDETEP